MTETREEAWLDAYDEWEDAYSENGLPHECQEAFRAGWLARSSLTDKTGENTGGR